MMEFSCDPCDHFDYKTGMIVIVIGHLQPGVEKSLLLEDPSLIRGTRISHTLHLSRLNPGDTNLFCTHVLCFTEQLYIL